MAFAGANAGLIQRLGAMGGRRPMSDTQSAFAGGLNTAADPLHVGPTESRRLENALLTEYGAAVKRRGTQRTHYQAFTGLQSGFSWVVLATAQELVVANGALWTGTYGIPMNWTPRAGALSASGVIGFANFRNAAGTPLAYIADGGPLNYWDGATLTINVAATPNARVLCVQNDRLWGITGTDNILYGSALGDGSSLGISASGGGSFAIATFGGQYMVGLLAIGSSLILLQRSAVSRFTGWTTDDFNVLTGTRGVSSDVGTVCASSVVSVENEGFFLSDRGFYSVTETAVTPESPQIRPMLASLSQSQWDNVRAAHHKALYEVRWSIPSIGVLVFNYRLRQWSGPLTASYLDHPVVAMWPTLDADARPIVLTGHDDGYVRRTERPSGVCRDDVLADGTAGDRYSIVIQCRRMFCNDAVTEKAYRTAWVTCNLRTSDRARLIMETDSDSIITHFPNLEAAGAWDEEGAEWDALALGAPEPWYWGGVAYDRQRLQLAGHGEWVDFTIQDDGLSESIFSRVDLRAFALGER